MLTVLLLASATFITEPKPQTPQPKQPIEFYNKEGMVAEKKRRIEKKKEKEKASTNHKFYEAFLERKTRVKFVRSYSHH